jgi:hypothetical protein
MATTTPNYGWAVPTSTDLVKDGATAIETLGDAIDASMNTALGTKKAGMVLLNTTSFSGVSSVSLPAASFTSTYRNYFVILENVTFTAGSTFGARLRASGVDSTGANYKYGVERRVIATNTASPFTNNGDTQFSIGDPNNATFYVDFINPQNASVTWYRFYQFANYSNFTGSGFFDLTTQFDSATFFPSAGTISGTAFLYGYNR